jgi:hypothetical protein
MSGFEREKCAPQVRIYVLSERDLPMASLSAIADYEIVVPRSKREAALIRKMAVESEQEFKREVGRVAAIVASLLVADSYLGCLYDNDRGCTEFQLEMHRTGGAPAFVEVVED